MIEIDLSLNKDLILSFQTQETEPLNKFSQIDIVLKAKNQDISLFQNDDLQEALERIKGGFSQLLKNNVSFPEQYDFKKGILYYSDLYILSFDDQSDKIGLTLPKSDPTEEVIWLLSTNGGYNSFLYQYQNELYLEISKSYDKLYSEEENIDIASIKEWFKNYSINYRFKLNKQEIEKFLKQLESKFKDI